MPVVDEEGFLLWQDVVEAVINKRPGDASCPYCKHRPLTIAEIDYETRVSCGKCGKYIQGHFE